MVSHLRSPRPAALAGPRVRRSSAYLVLLAITLAIGATLTFAIAYDHQTLTAFPVPSRAAYVPAPDPIRAAEEGLPPSTTNNQTPTPSPAIRTIEVLPAQVNLLTAGSVVRAVATTARTLPQVAAAVHDPAWITATNSTIQLNAALIIEPRANFVIEAPTVRAVHLLDKPGVILGARGGALTISDVAIASWSNGPVTDHTTNQPHPSVMAGYGANMDITNTTFTGLGWDWNGSYGVSWMSGSTGGATASTFADNFIGVYTDQVGGLRFDQDTFRANLLYGLDPHSFSHDLSITNATAEDNRGNGIIFSNHVTNSVIKNSVSRNNGENGIMMDATSTDNTIRANLVVGNSGDGIVTSNSPSNRIERNQIEDNRVGVHVGGSGADSQTLSGNLITGNILASQGLSIPAGNNVTSNGGEWLPNRLILVWMVTVAAFVVVALGTWLLRARAVRVTRQVRPV